MPEAMYEGKIVSLLGGLDKLRYEAGFWIDDELYPRALTVAKE